MSFINEAKNCIELGNFQKAIDLLDKIEPSYYSWYLLGKAYIGLDYYLDAKRAFSKCLYYEKGSIGILIELGDIEIKLENYSKAEGFFSKALKIDKNNNEIFYSLGDLEFSLKNFKKAAEFYKRSIEVENSKRALLGLADSYFQLKMYDDAKKTYASIYSLYNSDNKYYEAELGIARVLFEKGMYNDAALRLEALYEKPKFQRKEVLFELIKKLY